jgi:agmatinase
MQELVKLNKFPIFIGGEHSLTPPAVKGIGEAGVVIVDAHLDFREEYLGERHSHACVARRVSEIVGMENLVVIGVRSMSREEKRESERLGLNYYDISKVNSLGMETILSEVEFDKIYLSLDMDSLDPSYAPGVGNPEFFGLTPRDISICLKKLRTKLVGFDVTEVNPIYDSGNTSSLTAGFIRDVIAYVWSVQGSRSIN